MVVFPEDSGPKISTTRPRGTPPTPSAASKEMEPVEMTEIGTTASFDPNRMIEPLPNCFSICDSARSIARTFSVRSSAMNAAPTHACDVENFALAYIGRTHLSALRSCQPVHNFRAKFSLGTVYRLGEYKANTYSN